MQAVLPSQETKIEFMRKSGKNKFNWPEEGEDKDIQIIPTAEVFCAMPNAPLPVSSRYYAFPSAVANALDMKLKEYLRDNEN